MSENKRTALEELSLVTRWKLRKDRLNNAELINSLGWLAAGTEERGSRARDFEVINSRLNELMANPDAMPADYRDVALLAQKLKGKKIPSLEEVRRKFYDPYDPKETAMIVRVAIEKAVKEYPSWAKVNSEYPSQGTPASGALIEGFGAFLGASIVGAEDDLQDAIQINRLYVLGLEELLITEKPKSPLLNDVIGWMQDEIFSFPEGLRPKITEAALRFRQN